MMTAEITKPLSILQRILVHKKSEIAQQKKHHTIADFQQKIATLPPPRPFIEHLQKHSDNAVIAEIKKASPTRGILRPHFDVATLAQEYTQGGACCLSVLTDEAFFQGHLTHIEIARSASPLPVLRKDFMIDPWQLYEARAAGADCILLIAALLAEPDLRTLYTLAKDLSLAVIVEVHTLAELRLAESMGAPVIGVNNRNLATFEVALTHTTQLYQQRRSRALWVSESGIHSATDIHYLNDYGIRHFLIGEHLMRAEKPAAALKQLLRKEP